MVIQWYRHVSTPSYEGVFVRARWFVQLGCLFLFVQQTNKQRPRELFFSSKIDRSNLFWDSVWREYTKIYQLYLGISCEEKKLEPPMLSELFAVFLEYDNYTMIISLLCAFCWTSCFNCCWRRYSFIETTWNIEYPIDYWLRRRNFSRYLSSIPSLMATQLETPTIRERWEDISDSSSLITGIFAKGERNLTRMTERNNTILTMERRYVNSQPSSLLLFWLLTLHVVLSSLLILLLKFFSPSLIYMSLLYLSIFPKDT